MADIKKTLLKKKVAGTVYGLYPETSADIVKYGDSSTVADELAKLIAKMGNGDGSVSQEIADAVEKAKKELLGIDETNTQINEAYDTLREIAEWITSDESGAAKIAADVAAVTKTVNGDGESDTGLVGAVSDLKAELDTEGTGVKARLTAAEEDIDALQATVDTKTTGLTDKVAALEASSTQVNVVASDFAESEMNDNDIYFVELAASAS
jgi:chromosome segregation ATPase